MMGVTAGVNATVWAVEGSTGVVHVSWRPSVGIGAMSTLASVLRPPLYAPFCLAALGFESRVRSAGMFAEAREIDRGGGRGVAKQDICGQLPFRYIQTSHSKLRVPQITIPSLTFLLGKLVSESLGSTQNASVQRQSLYYYVHFLALELNHHPEPIHVNPQMIPDCDIPPPIRLEDIDLPSTTLTRSSRPARLSSHAIDASVVRDRQAPCRAQTYIQDRLRSPKPMCDPHRARRDVSLMLRCQQGRPCSPPLRSASRLHLQLESICHSIIPSALANIRYNDKSSSEFNAESKKHPVNQWDAAHDGANDLRHYR